MYEFCHILSGVVEIEEQGGETRTYRAGDSVLEAIEVPHTGTNTGTVPMRLLAVYMGGGEAANTVPLTEN